MEEEVERPKDIKNARKTAVLIRYWVESCINYH